MAGKASSPKPKSSASPPPDIVIALVSYGSRFSCPRTRARVRGPGPTRRSPLRGSDPYVSFEEASVVEPVDLFECGEGVGLLHRHHVRPRIDEQFRTDTHVRVSPRKVREKLKNAD